MRQKLNENPVVQIVLVAVLLVAGGFLLLTSMSGGEESGAESAPAAATETSEAATSEVSAGAEAGVVGTPSASATAVSAPAERSLPRPVETAYEEGSTIVLLLVHDGGIDDHLVAGAAEVLEGMPNVAFFSAYVSHIARYAPITGPLGVNQAPALIVIRPRRLNDGAAAPATVTYGFQSAGDVRQAVRDATYNGPQLTYSPH